MLAWLRVIGEIVDVNPSKFQPLNEENILMVTKNTAPPRIIPAACIRNVIGLCLCGWLSLASAVNAAPPDLTGAGVIAALKSEYYYSSRPYSETYNLGATGLRGWIYIAGNNAGDYGLITEPSRQILVTVASAPASAVLAVDDVILGAMAGSSGTVPAFSSDCRKAFGVAIGEAEKAGAGTLRVKRWRAGVTTDVNIPMTIMGDYTATSPYSCPKSALVLANARIKLVSELKAAPYFLGYYYAGAINGLALLASVAPGDADYAYVQTRLKSFADALAGNGMGTWGMELWDWSYMNIFLSDYFQPLMSLNASRQATLIWPSATGTLFTIERSTSLLGWSQIATNLVGQPGHTSYTDTTAPADAAQLFYRVRLD